MIFIVLAHCIVSVVITLLAATPKGREIAARSYHDTEPLVPVVAAIILGLSIVAVVASWVVYGIPPGGPKP